MKKLLEIVGISLIAGAVVYILLSKNKKANNTVPKGTSDENTIADSTSLAEKPVVHDNEAGLDEVKASAVGNMYRRHEDAVGIMKESVDSVLENVQIPEGLNNDIDQLSAELDKMLSED